MDIYIVIKINHDLCDGFTFIRFHSRKLYSAVSRSLRRESERDNVKPLSAILLSKIIEVIGRFACCDYTYATLVHVTWLK